MKKSILLLYAFACLFMVTTSSCRKQKDEVNITVNVKLEPNQVYQYTITKLGDKDDNITITKDAEHALLSRVSAASGSSGTLFEYTPAQGYTGTDEVVVSAVEPARSGGKHGNCSKSHHHEDEGRYTFKITVGSSD